MGSTTQRLCQLDDDDTDGTNVLLRCNYETGKVCYEISVGSLDVRVSPQADMPEAVNSKPQPTQTYISVGNTIRNEHTVRIMQDEQLCTVSIHTLFHVRHDGAVQ